MHNSKLKQITVALCVVLMPVTAFAAGLGKLNVVSGLGQPLVADIELLSITPEELNSISAAIATEDAYATQGIERPASHSSIKVEVAKSASGKPILKLKSSQPITEPFLDMLIQVDWSSGRLLREYTVLLDPPGYTPQSAENAGSSASVQAPAIRSSKNDAMTDETMVDSSTGSVKKPSKASKKKKKLEVKEDNAEVVASAPTGEEYVTQRGDTLAKIARESKLEGVSLEQMLVGLYEANPGAFAGKNMNRLKVGQIIRQPSAEELAAISKKQARREIRVQTANWNAYRNKLAGIVANAEPAESEVNTQSATGKVTSAEDKSKSNETGPKDVVKLSNGEVSGSTETKALQDKINALQEETIAREKSVKEAQEKTAALEKQITDMQKLLAMKNNAMTDMQKQAEDQAKVTPPEVKTEVKPPVVTPPPPVVTPPEVVKPSESKPAEPAVKPVEEKPSEAVVPVEKPKTPDVKIKTPVKVPEPEAEVSLLDGLNLPMLGGLGSLLAALGGGWWYLRNKRKKNLADFEQGIMTSGGLKANTVFGNTSTAGVDTGDTSFLTDFSQSATSGMIDTNDVDPIAEAEVYMAYGRDAQAEEILKDAISKEPKRHELHLKLLEMYSASKNIPAFETIAGELYTSLGAEDPTWAKVAAIGVKLEPSNPLYQSKHATGASEKLDVEDFSNTPLASESDLDFSFDNEALVQNFEPTTTNATNTSDSFDLDLGTSGAEQKTTITEPMHVVENTIADTLSLGENEFKVTETAPVAKSNDLEFDMGELGKFETPKTEATTKTEVIGAVAATTAAGAAAAFMHTMPGLEDLPVFDMSNDAKTDAETLPVVESFTEESFTSESFDMSQFDEPVKAVTNDEHTLLVTDPVEENDFNFDLSTITPNSNNFSDVDLADANTFDLSSINLEMNEPTPAATKVTDTGTNAVDSIEIETKLDLVVAYMEMDDKVGAKELIDEVLKEGGTSQRKRAEELLAKLA